MIQEIERQKKVISMMITAHSAISDKYHRLSSFFENSLLFSSVILNALVFVDSNFIQRMTSIGEDAQRVIAGIASIVVFGISVVLIQVRWKEKAEAHQKAADHLFLLLQDSRKIILREGEENARQIEDFFLKYTQVFETIVKIPDHRFNYYKSIHKRKVELSKLIDKHPGSYLWVLKFKLFISSLKSNAK